MSTKAEPIGHGFEALYIAQCFWLRQEIAWVAQAKFFIRDMTSMLYCYKFAKEIIGRREHGFFQIIEVVAELRRPGNGIRTPHYQRKTCEVLSVAI